MIDGLREKWARMRWSDNWARGNPAFVACCQKCQHRWTAVVTTIPMCPRCSSEYVCVDSSATDQMRAQHATGIG